MSEEIKTINAGDYLLKTGLLFRINKEVLHPLGLALAVNIDDDGNKVISNDLWDYRDDPEGLIYDEHTLQNGERKLDKFYEEYGTAALNKRRELLGYVIQEDNSEVIIKGDNGMTITNLENCIETAKRVNAHYVGVLIAMEGFPKPEVIINQTENFDSKLDYYKAAYDENLNHKYSKGIKMTGFTYGETFDDIENDLLKGSK